MKARNWIGLIRAGVVSSRQAFIVLALAAFALLGSGCATPALWKHTAARDWSPEFPPKQVLMTTTTGRQDVVVVFEQYTYSGQRAVHRLVAWNVSKSPDELVVGEPALQQLTNACDRVVPMPVFDQEPAPCEAASARAGYVVREESPRFTIHREGVSSETFELPGAHQDSQILARVAGMPFAVAADAALVGVLMFAGANWCIRRPMTSYSRLCRADA